MPVLSQASIAFLQPRPGGAYVDCTVGAGGHARLILQRIGPHGRLLGIDRDETALEAARRLLAASTPAPVLRRGDFRDLVAIARAEGFDPAHGVLFDLGVSSLQLDDPERGFSFRGEGPLDMRMDRRGWLTADRVVNRMPERELAQLIRTLGQERWAARIARFIVDRRPLRTTRDLAEAVAAAIPRRAWPRDLHPATRTFQAIRMHVNDELPSLEEGLRGAVDILAGGGRLVVISFHSLEDGTVKRLFERESRTCVCPPGQPVCTCGHRPRLRVLTRRPLRPSPEEIASNPRSRSARLRAAERI
ncbi:MAG TPA: 16S rRNA (cytosine(1402)-N(4))-methyltransferase RsmH [Candidatus Dormibacteraeota bacterium]|nr:16S rRNA (cytosine(1402)-N(4))-methyltransferase RsmH [Candidatus Dormibacteraeota bacterium]